MLYDPMTLNQRNVPKAFLKMTQMHRVQKDWPILLSEYLMPCIRAKKENVSIKQSWWKQILSPGFLLLPACHMTGYSGWLSVLNSAVAARRSTCNLNFPLPPITFFSRKVRPFKSYYYKEKIMKLWSLEFCLLLLFVLCKQRDAQVWFLLTLLTCADVYKSHWNIQIFY